MTLRDCVRIDATNGNVELVLKHYDSLRSELEQRTLERDVLGDELKRVQDERYKYRSDLEAAREEVKKGIIDWTVENRRADKLELKAAQLKTEVERLRGLLARIEFELKNPMMDGSNVVRARDLAEQRRQALQPTKEEVMPSHTGTVPDPSHGEGLQ